MANLIAKTPHTKQGALLLIDDKYPKKNNYNTEPKKSNYNTDPKKTTKELDLSSNPKLETDLKKTAEDIEKEYSKIKSKVLDDLVKDSEIHLKNQKDDLFVKNQTSFDIFETNKECSEDENKIYNCLKTMNKSTTNFVNSYNRCFQYLRMYEICVQKVKV
ncbi:conserved protein, unknown function [Hepatocystis sp. ex Piliocolobus tephrosceles]|nr:conserved protein, unknown function [Hepatocystis sp. ex Piliocolobus tephrosceles]